MSDVKVLVPDKELAENLDNTRSEAKFEFIGPLRLVLVRVFRTWLQYLMAGLLSAGVSAVVGVAVGDFKVLMIGILGSSVSIVVVCLIQNLLEVSAQWDKEKPELRG